MGILFLQMGYLQDPEPGLVPIYLNKVVLIVAAKDKLAKEFHLPFVLPLGLQFVDIGGAQVFDAFGELFLIEQHFVDTDEQLVGPVGIELATKTVIGQIGKVVLKNSLKPFQKGTLPSGPFLRDQAQYGQHLYRFGIQQLQIVQSKFIVLPKNVTNKSQGGLEVPLLRIFAQRGVCIIKILVFLFEVDVVRDTGEPIVLGYLAQVILAMVLANGLNVPVGEHFIEMAGDGGHLDHFIIRSAHPDVGYIYHNKQFKKDGVG